MPRRVKKIDNAIGMDLAGGNFHTGNTVGNSETLDNLTLSAGSSIGLGTGVHSLTFADATGIDTNGLTITGWQGVGGNNSSGTAGRIFFSSNDFTVGELAAIYFDGYGAGARQLAGGEIVPDVVFGTGGPAVPPAEGMRTTVKGSRVIVTMSPPGIQTSPA